MSGRLITSQFQPLIADPNPSFWKDVLHAVRVIVSRRELLDRDPRLLEDIGLTRAQALAEAARAPWDTLPPPRGPRGSGSRCRPAAFRKFFVAYRRHRSRRRIAQLDGRMLKDIGVSFAEAEEEANKPFWRD